MKKYTPHIVLSTILGMLIFAIYMVANPSPESVAREQQRLEQEALLIKKVLAGEPLKSHEVRSLMKIPHVAKDTYFQRYLEEDLLTPEECDQIVMFLYEEDHAQVVWTLKEK